MIDLAVPMADASEGWLDPDALAAVGRFYRQVLGDDTYRAFAAHRRRHRTPPSVVSAIMMDLIGEIARRPPERPLPSPPGPPRTPVSSAAASPSPATPATASPSAAPPGAGIPQAIADAAEVVYAPAPEPGPAADPAAGMHRFVNLGNLARTRVEPADAN